MNRIYKILWALSLPTTVILFITNIILWFRNLDLNAEQILAVIYLSTILIVAIFIIYSESEYKGIK